MAFAGAEPVAPLPLRCVERSSGSRAAAAGAWTSRAQTAEGLARRVVERAVGEQAERQQRARLLARPGPGGHAEPHLSQRPWPSERAQRRGIAQP